MNRISLAGLVSAGAITALVGFSAPAVAAPAEISSAQTTISGLQDQGFTVVVHNPAKVPLGEASVVSVRQGPEMVERTRDRDGAWISDVSQSIVFVDVQ